MYRTTVHTPPSWKPTSKIQIILKKNKAINNFNTKKTCHSHERHASLKHTIPMNEYQKLPLNPQLVSNAVGYLVGGLLNPS